jgi:AcrR family transcriptional regulator
MAVTEDAGDFRATEQRVLDAAKESLEKWGSERVTVEDICNIAGVSRATLYRMFPGGKDVLFEALRVRELEEFFQGLRSDTANADNLEDLLVAIIVSSGRRLRDDAHLAATLAAEPGVTVTDLTVDGMPRIIRVATTFMSPMVESYLGRDDARRVVEVLSRLVLSFFLAPSPIVDITNEESTRTFVRAFIDSPVSANQKIKK